MSLGGCVRRIGFKVRDRLLYPQHESVSAQWQDIERVLSSYKDGWPVVESHLHDCLEWATRHCQFYKQFQGKGLMDFPVLTKLDFIKLHDEILADQYQGKKLHKMQTSGSTGTPFEVVQDVAKRNRVLAELKYFGEIAGYRSHEKMFYYRACPWASKRSMFWSNVWQPDIASLSDARAEELYKEQKFGNPHATLAYASTYEILTRYWLSKGYRGNPSVKAVFSGSEILTDDVRLHCKQFWPNCEVYSRYSNMENGILAQENGEANKYIINWASYWVEILKLDCDDAVENGEIGRIVITDVFNRAFPMIRYDTGDIGSIHMRSGFWPLLSSLEGRRLDIIYAADGSILSPHILSNALHGIEFVKQWQFIQIGDGQYLITFIPCDGAEDEALKCFEEKEKNLRSIFGENAMFKYGRVDSFPILSSRKHKMIVQKWKI